jgi:uncharacterized protein Yka (UPF0111/DUF47 family)
VVDAIEEAANRIVLYRLAVEANLAPVDVLRIITLKEVVDTLEDAADAFETVANTVESIAVKES